MLTNEILSAICRTFVHSIWQGLVAAILAGAVLALTRRSAAATRYNFLGAILVLCILAIAGTLWLELRTVSPVVTPQAPPAAVIVAPAAVSVSYWDVLMSYLNTHAPFIMLVWCIVFLFKCFRMGFGFYHIRHIRRHSSDVASENWQQKVKQLAGLLGIRRNVRLLESAMVQVPLTSGMIKPCIFVPLGLLTQLPADQVEAILLHELAHIRRKDYFVNILQTFTESVFFFNPALLWISARLREEREACCDDVAMAHTPHQASYLHALVNFAGGTQETKLGMAFTRKQHLLQRIKRMLTRENQKLSIMEKSVLMTGLIAISAFSLVPDPVIPAPENATPFIVYKPLLSSAIPSNTTLVTPRVNSRDTLVPGKTSFQYTVAFDSTYHIKLDTSVSFNLMLKDIWQQLKVQSNIKTDLNFQFDSTPMQYRYEWKFDTGRQSSFRTTPFQQGQFNYSFSSEQDSLIKYYVDTYQKVLEDKKSSLNSYQFNYSFAYDSSTAKYFNEYQELLLPDTSGPRKKIRVNIDYKTKDSWRKDSLKRKSSWQTHSRYDSLKTGKLFKTTPQRVIFLKPHTGFKSPTDRVAFEKPRVQFKKMSSPAVAWKPFPRTKIIAKNNDMRSEKPKVIFRKPQTDSGMFKKQIELRRRKEVNDKEVSPAPPAKKNNTTDKQKVLEEKLPIELYNSIIFPPKIDC